MSAVRRLQELGIRVEIGVILFDPLSTLDEIEDSIRFMQASGLTFLASSVSSELRLQVASGYVRLLKNHERKFGVQLMDRIVDPDTISMGHKFADDSVKYLFTTVKSWNARIYPFYYPAKSLTRFGTTSAIGESAHSLRQAIEQFRYQNAEAILRALEAVRSGHDPDGAMEGVMSPAVRALAASIHQALDSLDPAVAEHPVVRGTLAAADTVSSRVPD